MRRKLGRDDRRCGMRLGAGVARDEADDPFDLLGLEAVASVPAAAPEAIEPEATVGIDHDFDDLGVGKRRHDRRPHRRAEHGARSEEHTSEFQSLMRTSYAVFCLKKKK